MQRYRAKLKAERGDRYDELKQRDAERNRKNRQLASQQRKGDKRATDKHRKKECERKRKQRAKKAEENKSKPVTPKRKINIGNKKRTTIKFMLLC
jgi:hypothetical protein